MRNAETVLGVIRERGRRRLPLEDIYRQLYNRDLYLRAYGRLYRNDGAMTPGVNAGNRGCHVPGEDRCDHRRPYVTSAIAGPQSGGRTSRRNRGSYARSGSPPGRTNCCKK